MMKIKEEKGSISAIVMATILFFITILSATYAINATMRKSQRISEMQTKSQYEAEFENIESIYNETLKKTGTLPTTAETMPYLPSRDYTQVNETNLSNGLVIQDKNGNQYVWVEVPKTSTVYPTAGLAITSFTDAEYTSIENDLHTYTNTYRSQSISYTDTYYSDEQTGLTSDQYINLKKAMLKSVYKNGGFWVGRYEVGDATSTASNVARTSSTGYTDTAVIKADQHPYDYITCSQSESLASKFAPNGRNSSLLFGVQWDLVLRYFESKGTTQADLKTNSTSWGNYYNASFDITKGMYNAVDKLSWILATWTSAGSNYTKAASSYILLTTGATDRNSKMNIYDMAGNVWEYTMEYDSDSSNPCTLRGGGFGNNILGIAASEYASNNTTYIGSHCGLRVALY